MISFETIKNNVDLYTNSIKNTKLSNYYSHLIREFIFDETVDFTEFVEFMKINDDRELCNLKLREIKKLGKRIEVKTPKKKKKKLYKYDDEDGYGYDGYDIEELEDEFFQYKMEYQEAMSKNYDLINQLQTLRTDALGIGTNKIKRRLNKLAETNQLAKALRVAIEIEDVNILAKKSFGKYREKNYEKKTSLIFDLIDIFDTNDWIYGIHKDNGIRTNVIIFFELPNTEQISFHANINTQKHKIKIYDKKWDGKQNSTYPKLLNSVKNNFSEVIY